MSRKAQGNSRYFFSVNFCQIDHLGTFFCPWAGKKTGLFAAIFFAGVAAKKDFRCNPLCPTGSPCGSRPCNRPAAFIS
jgi:hypothetical protein